MLRSGFPVRLLLGTLWVSALGAAVSVAQDKTDATAAQSSAAAPVANSPDAHALGLGEGLLEYCAQNDPEGAAKVRARLKQLTQGVAKEALAEARKSGAYQKARDAEAEFISKVDSHNAHRLCSEWATGGK